MRIEARKPRLESKRCAAGANRRLSDGDRRKLRPARHFSKEGSHRGLLMLLKRYQRKKIAMSLDDDIALIFVSDQSYSLDVFVLFVA